MCESEQRLLISSLYRPTHFNLVPCTTIQVNLGFINEEVSLFLSVEEQLRTL